MSSRGKTLEILTELVTEECCRVGCGVLFAMPADLVRRRRKDHGNFYCPNGHGQHYGGETEEEKLRKQLAAANGDLKWYRERAKRLEDDNLDLAHKIRGQKAAKSRIVNRLKAGLCPWCGREYPQIGQHIQEQHPEKVDEANAE